MKIIKNFKSYLIIAVGIIFSQNVNAQLKVGNNPTTINPSAMLEVEATNKGFLPPKVALTNLTSAAPLAAHVQGMIIFNTTTGTDITPGLYMSDGTKWGRMKLSGDLGGDESGDFSSKGVIIDASTPTNSEICVGPVCIRYNGSAANNWLQVRSTLPNNQFFHSYGYWGTVGASNTAQSSGSMIVGQWYDFANFGGSENTEGTTMELTMIDKATSQIRNYTIKGHIIISSDSQIGKHILYLRIYKN